MKIKRYEVKAYENEFICQCGGTMKSSGRLFPVFPALYEYKCQECGKIEKSKENPGIVYERDESSSTPLEYALMVCEAREKVQKEYAHQLEEIIKDGEGLLEERDKEIDKLRDRVRELEMQPAPLMGPITYYRDNPSEISCDLNLESTEAIYTPGHTLGDCPEYVDGEKLTTELTGLHTSASIYGVPVENLPEDTTVRQGKELIEKWHTLESDDVDLEFNNGYVKIKHRGLDMDLEVEAQWGKYSEVEKLINAVKNAK